VVAGLDAALAWLKLNKLLLGEAIAGFVEALTTGAPELFSAISEVLGQAILGLTAALFWFHPLVLLMLIAGLAWYLQRAIGLVVFVVLSLLLVINLGYWDETLETLALVRCRNQASPAISVSKTSG